MIQITHIRPASGRVAATFSAVVGDLALSGCALIRRDNGYVVSVPRVGSPSRSVLLNAAELAALETAAVEALRTH